MIRKIFFGTLCLMLLSWALISQGFAQEDKIVQVAIDAFKKEVRLPPEGRGQFIEKKESPLLVLFREIVCRNSNQRRSCSPLCRCQG